MFATMTEPLQKSQYEPKQLATFSYVDEDSINEEFLCAHICYQPLVDPVVHNMCQHSFCYSCIEKAHWKCPSCRIGTQSDFTRVQVRMILNLLEALPVRCNQCNKQMTRGSFVHHQQNCSPISPIRKKVQNASELVACSAHEFGCASIVPRDELKRHLQECRYEQSRWLLELVQKEALEQKQATIQLQNQLKEIKAEHHTEILELKTKILELKAEHQKVIVELNTKYSTIEKSLVKFKHLVTRSKTKKEPVLLPPDESIIDTVACGTETGDIEIWNMSTDKKSILKGHTKWVSSIVQLVDGALVSASGDKTIRIWDLQTEKCTTKLEGHTGTVYCVIRLQDGRIASGSDDGTIRLWNTSGESQTITVGASVRCLLQLFDGTLVSGDKAQICFWDVSKKQKIRSLSGHTNVISCLTQLRDGTLVSASHDKTIVIWRDTARKILEGHTHWIRSIVELADGRLASSGYDSSIRVWNVNSGECEILTGHTGYVRVLVQINTDTLISGSDDNSIRVWRTGKCIKEIKCSHPVWTLTPIAK